MQPNDGEFENEQELSFDNLIKMVKQQNDILEVVKEEVPSLMRKNF